MIRYWHFAPGDSRLSHFDNRQISKGSKFSLDVRMIPVFGERGFHASTSILLSMSHGFGSILSEVNISGRKSTVKTPDGELVCARKREHIDVVDFRKSLIKFCFFCVREYIEENKVDIPKEVKSYIDDPAGKSIKVLAGAKGLSKEIVSIIERLVEAFLDYKHSSLVVHNANMMWHMTKGSINWFKAENFMVDQYKEVTSEQHG